MDFRDRQVVIKNGKQVLIAAERLCIADTAIKRLKGLMFLECLPPAHAILLTPCNSIHTFFMKFPIDVVCLDKNMQIIRVSPCIYPNKIVVPPKKACHILEFPSQTVTFFSGTVEIK